MRAKSAAVALPSTAVAPALSDTDMTRALPEETRKTFEAQTSLGKFGEAQDIADAVLFLASAKQNTSPVKRCTSTAVC